MGKPPNCVGSAWMGPQALGSIFFFKDFNTEYPYRKLETYIKNYSSDWKNYIFKNNKTELCYPFIYGSVHFLVTVTMVARRFDKRAFFTQYIERSEITANWMLSDTFLYLIVLII